MKAIQQLSMEANKVSIYRVPENLCKVEPSAYDPHFISIGPYHHHHASLHTSDWFKWLSLNRLIGSGQELDKLLAAVNDVEHEARGCYS